VSFLSIDGYEPKHLSFSTLNTYRLCAKMFWFQKVAGLEQHPGFAAIGGNAVHEASEAVERIIMEGGFDALDQTTTATLDIHTSPEDSESIGPDTPAPF